MSSVKSSSAREPPTRLRILYYRSVHGPARRGGSAWWSVGLIGSCRSLTAALLGHPKVRGSNPRPDTFLSGLSSQTFIPWSSIEAERWKHGLRTGDGVARWCDAFRAIRPTAAASWDRFGRHRIASLLPVVRPNLPRVQQLHAESVRECGVDVRLVLLVIPHRRRRNHTPWRRRICVAPRPRATPDGLRCDGSSSCDSDRGDGIRGRHARGGLRRRWGRRLARAREVPEPRIPRNGRRGVLPQMGAADGVHPAGSWNLILRTGRG